MGIRFADARLEDQNLLLSGCRPHSCNEKGALIIDATGQILGAGLINPHCGRAGHPRCEFAATLTVFVKNIDGRDSIVRALEQWASEVVPAGDLSHELAPDSAVVLVP
jgi:hypothetical protein